MWRIQRFFEKLNKVIRFIPIIWKSVDYDWTGILQILQHKLKQVRICLENGHLKGSPSHAKKIRICELLINRLLHSDVNDYCEYEMEQHNLRWGKIKTSFEKIDNSDLLEWVMTRDKIKTVKDEKVENEEFMKIIKKQEYMQEQDICYLFNLMRKNLTSWWD